MGLEAGGWPWGSRPSSSCACGCVTSSTKHLLWALVSLTCEMGVGAGGVGWSVVSEDSPSSVLCVFRMWREHSLAHREAAS